MHEVTKISFEGKLMIRFADNVINMWFEGLPKDVHFSLSINKNSPDINFHVTREVDNIGNKPKITVCVIANQICDALVNDIGRYLLHKSLTAIDINKVEGTVAARFISYTNMGKSSFNFSIEKEIKQLATNFIKYRGKKELRIKENLVDMIDRITPNELAFIELYDNSPELADIYFAGIESGIIVTDEMVYSVIYINGKWYVANNSFTLDNFLSGFFGEKVKRQIFYSTKKAVVIVRTANSYDELRHLDNPFRIRKNKVV